MCKRIISIFLVILVICSFASCDKDDDFVEQDYVSQLTLDETSATKKAEVTVKTYIDGDTTHFNIDDATFPLKVLKARYLAINTPESTGKIEEWGKAASNYTKDKLSKAYKILIESDEDNWNYDSTGSRYLVFVWYKTDANSPWRNLNLEILQNGYAKPSNTGGNHYGEICLKALQQAKTMKLHVFSGLLDPDFYYGEAQPISLKELRINSQKYLQTKVVVEGVVTRNYNNGVYIESYDSELEMYFGTYCYYSTSATSEISNTLNIGNFVRVLGSYTEFNGSYQISGIGEDLESDNTTMIIEDEEPIGFTSRVSQGKKLYNQPYTELSSQDFSSKTVNIDVVSEVDGQEVSSTSTYFYKELILGTTVSMNNLTVSYIYTEEDEESSSAGAMSIYCKKDNISIEIRTVVLKDKNGNIITADAYNGKTISVKGIADVFVNKQNVSKYQIKILRYTDIVVED